RRCYRFRKDKLKISIVDHLYRYWLAIYKERVTEHICLVPLIVSSLQRERHVTARQRLPVRKLKAISKPDVDRTAIGARGPGFREARHVSLGRMIELHQPAVEQEERHYDRRLVVCEKIVECFGRRRYTIDQLPALCADSSLFGPGGAWRGV